MTINEHTPLGQVREHLREHWHEGLACPACKQRVQLYRRKLNSGMAYALVVMWKRHGTRWQDKTVTLRGVGAAARDESLLRFWGLLEEDTRPREDGGRAGIWRVTLAGAEFVREQRRVQSHALVFDNVCYGLDGDPITIRQALGNRFNLDELLGGL